MKTTRNIERLSCHCRLLSITGLLRGSRDQGTGDAVAKGVHYGVQCYTTVDHLTKRGCFPYRALHGLFIRTHDGVSANPLKTVSADGLQLVPPHGRAKTSKTQRPSQLLGGAMISGHGRPIAETFSLSRQSASHSRTS